MAVMRLLLATMLALMSFSGCCVLPHRDPISPKHEARHPPRGSPGADTVFLDVAVVERPAGDPFLDREVWEAGDEQGVELEIKPALEENGLRVCQFGLLPDRLQALLASPRTCAEPRRLHGEPDRPIPVALGQPRWRCEFAVRLSEESKPVALSQARCEFEVLPIPEEDGRIRLRFTPRVKHGQARIQPKVARDPDGQLRWAVEPLEPTEEFAGLRFELCVGPGEYVAVGTRSDQPGTLGHAFFMPGGEQPRQSLLMLRATRVTAGEEASSYAPPLAWQASWLSARGSAP
jgi:hypothetical protein